VILDRRVRARCAAPKRIVHVSEWRAPGLLSRRRSFFSSSGGKRRPPAARCRLDAARPSPMQAVANATGLAQQLGPGDGDRRRIIRIGLPFGVPGDSRGRTSRPARASTESRQRRFDGYRRRSTRSSTDVEVHADEGRARLEIEVLMESFGIGSRQDLTVCLECQRQP